MHLELQICTLNKKAISKSMLRWGKRAIGYRSKFRCIQFRAW